MAVLTSQQRTSLEKAVIKARKVAELGARNALKAFAVDHHEPYSHMDAEQRALRNKLRSKARLLGDHTVDGGGHTIDKLSYELAYEYWHSMLFAKFLEANNLLIHPEHGIAVTLEECEELGQEEGHEDKWTAAAFYASKMLPAIFRPDDPLMQIKYATEDRVKLEQILEGIENDLFTANDSLGWVYQYWQSEAKEAINASGDKIDGERLPAVTQLFTEPYMVHFLIDNTLGAWWTARNPGVTPPVDFKYLRTLEDGTPAAGSFEDWPDQLSKITMLDPCMGSGHFVVEVFNVMAALRMQDEGLTKEEACDAVIKENIHGLELDARCTQIAAFNLALAAWKFCGTYRTLPEMNLACCGIAPKGKKEDWIRLANLEEDKAKSARLRGGLERMYDLFQQAPELGSLIDPTFLKKDMYTSDFKELQPFLEEALGKENNQKIDERSVIAAGVAKAGNLLQRKYDLVLTNVPYLGFKKQGDILKRHIEKVFPKSKMDLATVFLERAFTLNNPNGINAVVTPQNWLYLGMYQAFREFVLETKQFRFVASLGSGAFSQITGEVVKAALVILSNKTPQNETVFGGISCSKLNLQNKILELEKGLIIILNHNEQKNNPDSRVLLKSVTDSSLLSKFSISKRGIVSGDKDYWFKTFWEVKYNKIWRFLQSTTENQNHFDGKYQVVNWSTSGAGMLRPGIGNESYGKNGIVINQMGQLQASLHLGELYDNNVGVITPHNIEDLKAIYTYCRSEDYNLDVRDIDDSMAVTNATLIKVPFDLEYWRKVSQEKYPNGLPKPYSDDPTQWLFHGHPKHTEHSLQVSISRLLGYQWVAENDDDMELAQEAKDKIAAIQELHLPIDDDGIVCIPAVNGELSAAERIREQILKIWGEEYDGSTIAKLLKQEGSKKTNLEDYLRDDYFQHHCMLFKNRPFIWHIWDGRKDGFAALVNYHKLDKATLEKLIYTYLGDWINQCQLKLQNNVSGADGLLSAANALKEKLQLILKGEPPYDLFIRWKPIEEQPIGWEPDINDGVRLNVYPFVQAGILRKKFNVKWKKDRGKNPTGSPWGPDRYNRYEDLDEEWKLRDEEGNTIPHLTTEVKRKMKALKETTVDG